MQDYLDRVVRPRLRILTHEPTVPDAASRYYRGVVEAIESLPDDYPGRGCLLLNSAAGFAAHDDAQRAVVDATDRSWRRRWRTRCAPSTPRPPPTGSSIAPVS